MRRDTGQPAPYNVTIRGNTIENCAVGINLLDGNNICVEGNNRFINCGTDFFADSDVQYTLKEPSVAKHWRGYR